MIQDFLSLSSIPVMRRESYARPWWDRHKHIDYHSRPSSTETLAAERRRK